MAKRKAKKFGKLPYSTSANNLPQAFEANARLVDRVALVRRRLFPRDFPDSNRYIPLGSERAGGER